MNTRENYLSNISFQGHEWIPARVSLSAAYWREHREDLEALCLRHPIVFPGFSRGDVDFDRVGQHEHVWTDDWGVKWQSEIDGLMGLVINSPLKDWAAFEAWTPPAPPPPDTEQLDRIPANRESGRVNMVSTEHGFLLMRLYYLRGYENFMMDVAVGEPRLDRLIDVLVDYWNAVISPYIAAGADIVYAADDQGTQTASMLGPKYFRRWLLPAYQRLFLPARRAGMHVFMHTDGYIMDIADELVECGLDIVNPQDLVNGIDAIAEQFKGRVCVRVDIDRQRILPFGNPGDVRELIREEVMKLGSPAGGLEFIAGIYPPTPLENVEALCATLEEYRTYWVGRTT